MPHINIVSFKYGVKRVYFNEADRQLICTVNWQVNFVRGKYYAVSSYRENGKKKQIKMHRLIMGVLGRSEINIDHKDGDGLNNRRDNLRIATVSQNVINTPPQY